MRPLKFRSCVECGVDRPSSFVRPADGVHGHAGICYACRPHRGRTREAELERCQAMLERHEALKLEREKQSLKRPPGRPRAEDRVNDSEVLKTVSDSFDLGSFFANPWAHVQFCKCCKVGAAFAELSTDEFGQVWCRSCAASVYALGVCAIHTPNVAPEPNTAATEAFPKGGYEPLDVNFGQYEPD